MKRIGNQKRVSVMMLSFLSFIYPRQPKVRV